MSGGSVDELTDPFLLGMDFYKSVTQMFASVMESATNLHTLVFCSVAMSLDFTQRVPRHPPYIPQSSIFAPDFKSAHLYGFELPGNSQSVVQCPPTLIRTTLSRSPSSYPGTTHPLASPISNCIWTGEYPIPRSC